MKAENINIFYDMVKNTFQNVLGAETERGDLEKSKPADFKEKISVLIKITGDLEGYFYLTFPEEVAFEIVEKLAGTAPSEIDSFAQSAISEFGNMVMGKVSSQFFDKGIEISSTPPEVAVKAENIDLFGETFILIPVSSDIGDVEIHIFLN